MILFSAIVEPLSLYSRLMCAKPLKFLHDFLAFFTHQRTDASAYWYILSTLLLKQDCTVCLTVSVCTFVYTDIASMSMPASASMRSLWVICYTGLQWKVKLRVTFWRQSGTTWKATCDLWCLALTVTLLHASLTITAFLLPNTWAAV